MKREGERAADQLRRVQFEIGYTRWAEGSVLTRCGETHVLCNATVEERLPNWLRNQSGSQGWVTAEYALLPRSTQRRSLREQRWPKGRTQEISRLIGRSLRLAVDLNRLGERQILVDCDVLQADGGTRTAAVTGGWLALRLALQTLIDRGDVPPKVVRRQVAAISVGLVDGAPLLDLDYREDVAASVDLNLVMTDGGRFVEIQGTAESAPFSDEQLARMLALGRQGIVTLLDLQQQALDAP